MITPVHKRFSFSRPITSYRKLRQVVGVVQRNRSLADIVPEYDYLNVGCGHNVRDGFVNLDYEWVPGVFCWDLNHALPFKDQSFVGIYSEHCLEHLTLDTTKALISEFSRVLKADGRVRIVVPDVEIHVNLYWRSRNGESVQPLYEEDITPLHGLNRIMRDHGHLYGYDFQSLKELLTAEGFSVERQQFKAGKNPKLLLDSAERQCESLYVEATKVSIECSGNSMNENPLS